MTGYRFHPSTTSYSGRSVDLLLLKYVRSPGAETAVFPDVSSSPMMVSGIEKLAQRFALLFLTVSGSVESSSEGTELMGQLSRGEIFDESALRSAACAANASVSRQIKDEDAELDTPDDEALDSSEVVEVSIDRATASVSITVSLVSKSGDVYVYVTPIQTGI